MPVALAPKTPIAEQLALLDAPQRVGVADAFAYCRKLARHHQENFPVLTSLVPRAWRDDFASVYAFCRWADDLADELGADGGRATRMLARWREELEACFAGSAAHPVTVALAETVRRRALPARPFHDLIDAFEQDQRVRVYGTWDELVGYCTRSADPVGRLVLGIGIADPAERERFCPASDAICTALQLTNFWQDVRRDLFERGRVYLPTAFEPEPGAWSIGCLRERANGPADDAFGASLAPLLERTRALFDRGWGLLDELRGAGHGALVPSVSLFARGGARTLALVERAPGTLWRRPVLSRRAKAGMVLREVVRARAGL